MLQKFGLGIDIVKVERFKNKPYSRNKIFYKKVTKIGGNLYKTLLFLNISCHFGDPNEDYLRGGIWSDSDEISSGSGLKGHI